MPSIAKVLSSGLHCTLSCSPLWDSTGAKPLFRVQLMSWLADTEEQRQGW